MQQDADFITADFLYVFRASCAHHQEYKILTQQPPVQVVMVVEKVCSNKICILLHHVGVLLTLYYDARKHKIKIHHTSPTLIHNYCGIGNCKVTFEHLV